MPNELRIPFESLLNRGIQRELVDPNNNNGFLNNTYTQAFTLIKVICETSKRLNDANNDRESRQYEIHNVIAFTGRRGTGKTSAMLSIADSLSELSSEKRNRFEIQDAFVQLPYINAAVLDEEEDIILIVLSRMFKKLDILSCDTEHMRKKDFHDTIRKLKEDMCKIHGHYVNLKDKSDLTSSYYSMENLYAKYNIRNEFAELVEKYTKFYNTYKMSNTTHLILCIDDVDMSRQDHMRIMQCIHQYFMIPNVVVMVTLNFPILTASLQQNSFNRLNTISDKESQNLHLAFEHTHDFLRKIIPSDMRITMPSWRKYDYRNLTPVKVNLGKSSELVALGEKFPKLKDSVLFKKLSECKDDDYTLSPKDLVLMLLADRTNVYLDVKGNKYHFMEPDSLRNLYDIFYMLYHMSDISSLEKEKETDDAYFHERKANRKILLDYLYFKLLPEYDLSTEEEKLINAFISEPIDRRGKRIWDYYFKRLTSEEEKKRIESIYGSDFYKEEKKRYKIENYSFGELFRILYSGSRLGLMDRKLVCLVLASFSFSLPQYLENEKWRNSSKNNKSQPNKYHNLRDIFAYTLIGTWCSDMFNGRQVDTVIYKDELETVAIDAFVKDIMLLLLMTSKSTREYFDVYDAHVVSDAGETSEIIRICNAIDPTAFIMNSLRIDERFENMRFQYKDSLYVSEINNDGEVTCYSLSKLLAAILIGMDAAKINETVINQLEIWRGNGSALYDLKNDNYKTLWYFLKYTDIAYNVIKRAVTYIIYKSENNLKDKKPNTRTPFHTIERFYEIVYKKLKEQDEVYFGLNDDSEGCFAESFRNNPIVKKFYEFDSSSGKSVPKHYDKCFNNGCGIEFRPDTVGDILSSISTEGAILLLETLPQEILFVEVVEKEKRRVIIKCIIYAENSILSIDNAETIITELANGKVSLKRAKEILEEYFEMHVRESFEDDSPQ